MRITVAVDGDVQLQRMLARFAGRLDDMSAGFARVADEFADIERRQFESEGGTGSGGWPALSPKYAAWKARHYPGRPILVRTGALQRSLTSRPFGVEQLGRAAMEVGTAVSYAGYHQRGGGRLPKRAPIDLREAQRNQLVKILQRWLSEAG